MPAASAIPGLKRLPKPGGFATWYWAASQISRETRGFRPRTVRLWHGQGEPSAHELATIAARAQTLSIDLHDWFNRPARRLRSKRGSIYFVRAGELVKIGFSQNVEQRMTELQAFFPLPLELLLTIPGSIGTERALHQRFRGSRVHRELFRFDGAIAAFIELRLSESHGLCGRPSTGGRATLSESQIA